VENLIKTLADDFGNAKRAHCRWIHLTDAQVGIYKVDPERSLVQEGFKLSRLRSKSRFDPCANMDLAAHCGTLSDWAIWSIIEQKAVTSPGGSLGSEVRKWFRVAFD
jgi:hypothetical protein